MKHTLGLAAVLAVFWLVLSGHYTPLMLAFAAASIALVVLLAHRMDIVDDEARVLRLGWRAPVFWSWLGAQILLSAWDVTRRVWTGRPALRPAMGRVEAARMSEASRVTLANSITLTPGTLSVAVDEAAIEIHALDEQLIRDLQRGAMAARVRRIEEA